MPTNDPNAEHRLTPIDGSPPDLFHPPAGCGYCARCPWAMRVCEDRIPEPFYLDDAHYSRCWLQHADAGQPVPELHYRSGA